MFTLSFTLYLWICCGLMTLTMIIIPPGGVVSRYHVVPRAIVVVCARRISRKGVRAVPLWYYGFWGPDSRDNGPVRVEKPDVRTILITDPECPIIVDYQALAVHGNTLSGTAVGDVRSEAVPCVCCGG